MLATPGSYEFNRRQPGSPWLSAGVSIAITAGLFTAALLSMKAAPAWIARRGADEAPSVMVRLTPPVSRPAPVKTASPKVAPHARTAPPVAVAGDPTVAPTSIPTGVPIPSTRAADTSASRGQSSAPPAAVATDGNAAPASAAAATSHGGAPVAPAGVTGRKSAPMTTDDLASLRKAKVQSFIELARTYVPTGQDLADLQLRKRRAEQVERRTTSAGNSGDVHISTGEGAAGVGEPGGGLSSGNLAAGRLPVAILEPGPSPAQRKRDEAIDADYRARLARLQARVVVKRDSVRADSLRRDSLARRGIIP